MDHISNFCKCLDYVLGGDHAAFEHGWVAGFPHRAMATHRIDCAAIYGVPWIPSRKTPFMLAYIYIIIYIYQHHGFIGSLAHDSKESAGVVSFFPYPMEVCDRLGLMCCNHRERRKVNPH
jgi:hypothetical protein